MVHPHKLYLWGSAPLWPVAARPARPDRGLRLATADPSDDPSDWEDPLRWLRLKFGRRITAPGPLRFLVTYSLRPWGSPGPAGGVQARWQWLNSGRQAWKTPPAKAYRCDGLYRDTACYLLYMYRPFPQIFRVRVTNSPAWFMVLLLVVTVPWQLVSHASRMQHWQLEELRLKVSSSGEEWWARRVWHNFELEFQVGTVT